MKGNKIGKMKSIMVMAILVFAALFVVVGPLFTDRASAAWGAEPDSFNISYFNTTAATSITGLEIVETAVNGTYIYGNVNITWESTNATGYNVTIDSIWRNAGNNTYYRLDTTGFSDGVHYINVTAWNHNSTKWKNATNGPIKVIIRNSMKGTPGVDLFEGGNYTLFDGYDNVNNLTTSPSSALKYHPTNEVDITVDDSLAWTNAVDYHLFYPLYNGSKGQRALYNLKWEKYSNVPGKYITGGSSYTFNDIVLDRAGLWVIDVHDPEGDTDADFSTIETFNSTVTAWFWVNTSTDYDITLSASEFYYNATDALTMTVKEGDVETESMVDIRYASNQNSTRGENKYAETGVYTDFYKNNTYFWNVGNYTAYAYMDLDYITTANGLQYYTEENMEQSTDDRHYNLTYGANQYKNKSASWISAYTTTYNWSTCGPFDPPEQNATVVPIQVLTREPYTNVPTGNRTMYWGFDGEVNITLAELSGGSTFSPADVVVYVFDDDDVNVTDQFGLDAGGDGKNNPGTCGAVDVVEDNDGSGYIHINMTCWGMNGSTSFADNGTWFAYIFVDFNGDRNLAGANAEWTEEWNATVEWTVAPGPDAQFKWIDDDGTVGGVDLWGSQKSNNDGIIPYIPTATNVPLDVEFYVYGNDGSYFGDVATAGTLQSGTCTSIKECAENITISGNSLFTGKLSDFPGYNIDADKCGFNGAATGVWSVPIVPTMSLGGGEITIQITAFNSSVSEKISIGGENYETNGSIVSVTPNDFMIDQENKTLTITVKNSETGVENPYVSVYLYYLDDGTITAANTMKPIIDHPVDRVEAVGGVYTISFNTTQQTTNQTTCGATSATSFAAVKAPRNLTVYVSGPGHREGYALIQMTPVTDLETHISVETFMAGKDYDDVTISCDMVGNSTEVPHKDDTATFFMKIVDDEGNDVTGTTTTTGILHNFYDDRFTGSALGDDYSITKNNVYGPQRPSTTFEAGIYHIYAWNNTHNSEGHNATFEIKAVEVTCDKAPFIWSVDANISATFTITYNGNPANGTLRIDNMSDKGAYNRTWTNCSFTGTSDASGVGNTSLEISKTKITNGVVTVHDISADVLHPNVAKQNITFWFKPTESGSVFAKAKAQMTVEVPSVTPDPEYIPLGRTTKVYCTATGRGETLSDVFIRLHGQGFDQNSTTDVDGRVAFSVTPASTGNISIDVGETGRTLADTVVYVVAWVIDASTDAEVNEGAQFTVTVVKEGTTDVVVGATVTIKGVGTDTTDSNGQVTFTAPDVTSDRTYTIKVTKEGYAPDPDTNTITVINIPRLTIVLPDEVQATTTFEVAVADDTGGAIVGAIITFNEKTYTTGVNGIAKLTAPKTKGDYPIEATFGTYVEATGTVTVTAAPGIPGFELLTLIAALGVAFILFRRRRR